MLSSLRNFFLALFISLIVFGAGAYLLLGNVQNQINGFVGPTESTTSPDNTAETDESLINNGENIGIRSFTVLIVGEDNGESQYDNEKKEADTIILFHINPETKSIMTSALSSDMRTDVKGYSLRLGAVYSEYGIDTLREIIRAYTGIRIDYYCVFNYESIKKLFDIWGEVEYTVPMDMYYKPKLYDETVTTTITINEEGEEVEEEIKPEINLKSGKQMLDGEKAVELLRYKSYANGNTGRVLAQIDFLKEVIRQKVTFENLLKAKEIYAAVKESVTDTNVDEQSFNILTDIIFSLSTYKQEELIYPGNFRYENGVMFYIPDVAGALRQYKEYRTSGDVITNVTDNIDNIDNISNINNINDANNDTTVPAVGG